MVSTTKGDKGTTRSHTVWRKYLEQFSLNDSHIYAFNCENGYSRKQDLNSASVVKNIYTLKDPISEHELLFVELLLAKGASNETERSFLCELIGFLNNDPTVFFKDTLNIKDSAVKIIGSKPLQKNQEELFSFSEKKFIPIFHELNK